MSAPAMSNYTEENGAIHYRPDGRRLTNQQVIGHLDHLTTRNAELEKKLRQTESAMDAYVREYFRLSDATERCKEIANAAQFRALKEHYFAALQEIESVLVDALNRGRDDG